LQKLLKLLAKIADKAEADDPNGADERSTGNLMTPNNLAIVIAPNLFRDKEEKAESLLDVILFY
jgi:hypothetical protein